jgi:hypothetical protein
MTHLQAVGCQSGVSKMTFKAAGSLSTVQRLTIIHTITGFKIRVMTISQHSNQPAANMAALYTLLVRPQANCAHHRYLH